MTTTIDKAGRVVIPAAVRERLGLRPGTPLTVSVEEAAVRLTPAVPPPELVRKRGRLGARPTVPRHHLPAIDVAALIEEERNRWIVRASRNRTARHAAGNATPVSW